MVQIHPICLKMPGGQRNRCFDIAKGIGIILVVCGHARAPFQGFLSLFHMALFFMISGFLYNDSQSKDFQSVVEYTKRKIKSLWVPYFLWNTVFVLLNNIFIKIGVYCVDPSFLEAATGERNELAIYFGLKDYVVAIIKGCLMLDTAQVGGALWFLRSLLVISVGHNLVKYFIKNIKYKNVIMGVIIAAAIISAMLMGSINSLVPNWESNRLLTIVIKAGRQLFAPYLVYLTGMLLKKVSINTFIQNRRVVCCIISFIMLVFMSKIGRVDLSMGIITNIFFFMLASILGWLFVMPIGYSIVGENILSKGLEYMGKHTMCIIALHLISFKLVSAFYLLITNSDFMLLASFPVLDKTNRILWVFYSLVGVFLPLLLDMFYRKCKKKYGMKRA